MSLAAGCNLVLAPGLVLGLGPFPAWGIAGAGWGTMLANAIAGLYALYLLRNHLRALSLRGFVPHLRSVLRVGAPTAAAQSLAPIAAMIVVAFAERISLQCVAAISLVGRVENFVLMYPMAIAASVQPLVGQLWGAKRLGAVQSVLATARRRAIRWSLACSAALVAGSAFVPTILSDDVQVRSLMMTGLWFTPIMYASMSIVMTTGSSIVAIGKATRSLRVAAVFSLLLVPGFLAAFSTHGSALGLYLGQSLAAAVAAFLYLRIGRAEYLIASGLPLASAPIVDPSLVEDESAR
jgi:Na+-driven multidrug efflux pump